jgi:hypothetical protein
MQNANQICFVILPMTASVELTIWLLMQTSFGKSFKLIYDRFVTVNPLIWSRWHVYYDLFCRQSIVL